MVTQNIPSSLIASYSQAPLSGQNNTDARSPIVLNSSFKPVTELEQAAPTGIRTGFQAQAPREEIQNPFNPSSQESGQQTSDSGDSQQVDARAEAQAKIEEQREKQKLLEDQREIFQLSARDREVRAHEQAHAAIGGQYAGAPQYDFERGPDGVNYAVGGEVSIDVSREPTPQETISKMQIVRRAALAPAEPSPQDRRVAAQASRTEAEARAELNAQRVEESARDNNEEESNSVESSNSASAPTGLPEDVVAADVAFNPVAASVAPSGPVITSAQSPSVQISSNVSLPTPSKQILSYSSDVQRNTPGALLDQLV